MLYALSPNLEVQVRYWRGQPVRERAAMFDAILASSEVQLSRILAERNLTIVELFRSLAIKWVQATYSKRKQLLQQ